MHYRNGAALVLLLSWITAPSFLCLQFYPQAQPLKVTDSSIFWQLPSDLPTKPTEQVGAAIFRFFFATFSFALA